MKKNLKRPLTPKIRSKKVWKSSTIFLLKTLSLKLSGNLPAVNESLSASGWHFASLPVKSSGRGLTSPPKAAARIVDPKSFIFSTQKNLPNLTTCEFYIVKITSQSVHLFTVTAVCSEIKISGRYIFLAGFWTLSSRMFYFPNKSVPSTRVQNPLSHSPKFE